MVDEPRPSLRAAGQNREVAVRTDGGAEGNVEVEAGIQKRLFQVP
jgi:hypothetical protein